MNMVLRVGHHTPGLNLMLYPAEWQKLLPDIGLQHNEIYKVDCEYFRHVIGGDDVNVTALIEEYVSMESGESVDSVIERNRGNVEALFKQARPLYRNERASRKSRVTAAKKVGADSLVEQERDYETRGYW